MVSATFRKASFGQPVTFSTISGVYLSPAGVAHQAALAPPDRGVVYGRALVAPTRRVVHLLILVPTDEEPLLVDIFVILVYEGGSISVVDYVLLEVPFILQNVVYEAPEERYVRPRSYRRVYIAHR